MLKSKKIRSLAVASLLLLALSFAGGGAQGAEDILTVTGVAVDRTAENAVVARDQAIAEARRLAFLRLAEKMRGADSGVEPPDDRTLAALVSDFQIDGERLSGTRYAATFTVRFGAGVKEYLPLPPAPGGSVLVLPYLETGDGRMLLWEDGNPWRALWQGAPPAVPGLEVVVPLGDIADIAAGSSDAAWSGDYAAVEALRARYSASSVVLAVAGLSGGGLVVDLYTYGAGRLRRQPPLMTPAAGAGDGEEMYRRGIAAVAGSLRALSAPGEEVAPDAAGETEVQAPPPPAGTTVINASMRFSSFPQWVEAQKRLAAVVPPLGMDITSISSAGAGFTLTFLGPPGALWTALAGQGIALAEPATGAQGEVHVLQLVN